MITTTEEKHDIPLDCKEQVISLLTDAIWKRDFKNFDVYIHNEWPIIGAITNNPKQSYQVTIKHEVKT